MEKAGIRWLIFLRLILGLFGSSLWIPGLRCTLCWWALWRRIACTFYLLQSSRASWCNFLRSKVTSDFADLCEISALAKIFLSESDYENLNTKQYNHTEDTCVAIVCDAPKSHGGAIVITMMITACLTVIGRVITLIVFGSIDSIFSGFALAVRYRYYKYEAPGMNLNYEVDTEQLDMRY